MPLAFVTLVVGQEGQRIYSLTEPSLKAWAKKLGARFYVIDDAPAEYPLAGKFHLGSIIEDNDRTLFVDNDILCSVDSIPSVFDLVPERAVGMHDDAGALKGNLGWVEGLGEKISESQGWDYRYEKGRVWNTGVIIASRQHAPYFCIPSRPLPISHCSEQLFTHMNLERNGVEMARLPAAYNWQWWKRRRMPSVKERPDIYVRHWAGCSSSQRVKMPNLRYELMSQFIRDGAS